MNEKFKFFFFSFFSEKSYKNVEEIKNLKFNIYPHLNVKLLTEFAEGITAALILKLKGL